MRAIEATRRIDDQRRLHLDERLMVEATGPVRVIILSSESDEPDERQWLAAAATNPAFDFLREPEEDVYTLDDGRPFDDAR